MYLTLWTRRASPLYVYRHFSRWLRTRRNPAGTRKVATLPRVRTLDHANPRKGLRRKPAGTLQVATLPRVQSLDHTNPRRGLRVTPKMCNFTSRSSVRPRQSMGRVARHADMLEKMCSFTSRSCVRPRQSRGRVARHVENVQLYLEFKRSTTLIHGKGCAWRPKCATLPRVRAFDHANPWEGLRVTPTRCNFTLRSRVRPRQSMVIFDSSRRTVGKRCNFISRSRVRPCQFNPWEGLRVTPKSCNFTSRSRVRPRQSMGRVACHAEQLEKKCNFTSRSRVRPRQSMGSCASRRKVATLPRVRAFDHALTSPSRARPRQSMVKVAFPIDGTVLAPALERIFKYTEM